MLEEQIFNAITGSPALSQLSRRLSQLHRAGYGIRTIEPLWFEGHLFQETLKKSSRQNKPTKPSERKSTAQRETRPQRFSSLVAKYALQDLSSDMSDSNFSDSADEYSSYKSESFGSESDSDDADI